MNKLKILALGMLCSGTTLYAQNESDALKYTQTFISGTARAQGVGGAFGAVGADFSATVINPAGLALYRRNEVMFGMGMTAAKSSTDYLGNTLDDNRGNFNIPSWGGVATKVFSEMGEDVHWGLVSVSIGGGMNRVASYLENIRFSGTNTQNSLLDYYKYSASGLNATDIINNFNSGQNNYANIPGAAAYYYYLLDTAGDLNHYKALTDGVSGFKLQQQQQMQLRGGANEYNITGGANLSNIVYVGAGFVIKHAYSESSILFDESSQGTVPNYNSSSLKQEINSSGVGLGGRLGIIVRPVDMLKLGFAVQTPMRMKMTDEYKFIMTSNNSDPANIDNKNVTLTHDPYRFDYYDYEVVSPAKLTMSGAFTLPKIGFISVDYETVDYTQMRMHSDNDFFTETNNAIKNNMQRANNLRIGAEVIVAEWYRLRAGYAQYSSPYKNNGGEDLNRYALTGGIGFLIDRVFVDFAVVNSHGKQFISPYTTGDANKPDPYAINSYSMYNFVLSGGIRF
jgi:hypothetical protein